MFLPADGRQYPNETPLKDDYPVFADYFYVVDGRVERSDVFGTVRTLRTDLVAQGRSAEVVLRCNIVARQADAEREVNEHRASAGPPALEIKTHEIAARQGRARAHNRNGWRKKRK